jgi:hypothetical protein
MTILRKMTILSTEPPKSGLAVPVELQGSPKLIPLTFPEPPGSGL